MRSPISLGLLLGCQLFLCQQRGLANMTCSPSGVHPGEKFTVTGLPANHNGWALLVQDGSDVNYVISFGYNPTTGALSVTDSRFPPPLAAKDFAKLASVTLDTSAARGLPFSVRTGRPLGPARRIFTRAGYYSVIVEAYIGGKGEEGGEYEGCVVEILTTAKDPNKLTCPKDVTLGAPFTIKDLPPRHEGYIFSITEAASETMHLVSFDQRVQSLFEPPIPPQEFGKLTEITVDPKTVMGLPVDLGSHRPLGPSEKIFANDGEYWIGVGPGFHPGIAPGKSCTVRFSNSPAPSAQ